MTIEQAIEHGEEQLKIFGGTHKEFIKIALETLRKFKQIKQIFDMWNDFKYEDDDVLAMISDMVYKGDDIK